MFHRNITSFFMREKWESYTYFRYIKNLVKFVWQNTSTPRWSTFTNRLVASSSANEDRIFHRRPREFLVSLFLGTSGYSFDIDLNSTFINFLLECPHERLKYSPTKIVEFSHPLHVILTNSFFFFFLYNERKVSLNRAFLDGTILFHLNKWSRTVFMYKRVNIEFKNLTFLSSWRKSLKNQWEWWEIWKIGREFGNW